MPNWKKVIVSGSDASLNSLYVNTSVTASDALFTNSLRVTGPTQITGSLSVTGSATLIGNLRITGSINITGSISTVEYIDFTVLPSEPAFNTGRLHWTDDTKTLQLDTDVNNFELEIGHQSVIRGRNVNSFTLTKGSVVYINGESGNRPTFATASWESDPSSATTIGIIAQDINNNQTGYAVTNGLIRDVNTNAFPPGTSLYLSSSGQYTDVPPLSPLHEVRLGKTITQATNGILYIDIQNGYEIGELHDVLITSASTGDLLVWNSGSQVWENTKQLTGSYAITGSLNVSEDITVGGNLFVDGNFIVTGSFVYSNSITTTTRRITTPSSSVLASDYRLGVRYTTTGSVLIQLPKISDVGERDLRFKDEEGNAGTNFITIAASGSDQIDGSSTAILNRDYIAISLYNDGVANWYIE